MLEFFHTCYAKLSFKMEINAFNESINASPSCYQTSYKTISCCNVVYKCITKLLPNQLQGWLPKFVSVYKLSSLVDTSLITCSCQELVGGYHRNKGSSRCVLNVDLQKAYFILFIRTFCLVPYWALVLCFSL